MKVRDYLNEVKPSQYHIFDSHQEAMADRFMKHADQDYVVYEYNVHKNNKPKVGDAFLYRRPGKSSKSRKFYIYGGGVINSITEPDENGYVRAMITKPFKLDKFIEQGDKYIEEFSWSSKEKTPGSWGHFWNQYGMNKINEEDYFGLVGDMTCTIPECYNVQPATIIEAMEEECSIENEVDIAGFMIEVAADDAYGRMPVQSSKIKEMGRHTDYEKLNRRNTKIGLAGEVLVMNMLKEALSDDVEIEHTSVVKGDGLGYDIKITYKDGYTVYIEVKTTKTAYIDGFYITPQEYNAAKLYGEPNANNTEYLIYRVYSFDDQSRTAKIKIYNDLIRSDKFKRVPTAWKVYLK